MRPFRILFSVRTDRCIQEHAVSARDSYAVSAVEEAMTVCGGMWVALAERDHAVMENLAAMRSRCDGLLVQLRDGIEKLAQDVGDQPALVQPSRRALDAAQPQDTVGRYCALVAPARCTRKRYQKCCLSGGMRERQPGRLAAPFRVIDASLWPCPEL